MRGFLARLFGTKAATLSVPSPTESSQDDREQGLVDLVSRMKSDVASGYYTSEEIITNACDYVEGELSRDEAERVARERLPGLIVAHTNDARNWPFLTDCDRLDEAFADLELSGIVTRQNFTCCGTCGVAEIGDEMAAVEAEGIAVRGYSFFHMQDTDSAVDGCGLYLNYGSVEEGEQAALDVGSEIARCLESHGLETQWNGSLNQRIHVKLDWKRRFPFTA